MFNFSQWLKEDQGQSTTPTEQDGPEAKWQKLIDLHRIQFTGRLSEKDLQPSDRAFIVTFFDTYKYSKQLEAGNTFETKIRGCTFKLGFFKNQKWAASITTDDSREVTEKFQVTESKIATLFELFEKALKQKSFKDILPIVTK